MNNYWKFGLLMTAVVAALIVLALTVGNMIEVSMVSSFAKPPAGPLLYGAPTTCPAGAHRWGPSRRVTSEHKVASFGELMAGEAGPVRRLVASLAVCEVAKPPAARRGVAFRVLDHELNILWHPGNE